MITDDPNRLGRHIRGIGFRTADSVAAKLENGKTAPQRLRAGVLFALQEAMDEGQCGLPQEARVKLAEKLLEVDASLIEAAIRAAMQRGHSIRHDRRRTVSLPEGPVRGRAGDCEASGRSGHRSHRVAAIDIEKAVPWIEKRTGKGAGSLTDRCRPSGSRKQGCNDHRRPGRATRSLGRERL